MWFLIAFVVACFLWSWHRLRYFSSRGVRTLPPAPFFGNLTAVTFARENFVDAIAAGYEMFGDQRYFGLYQYHVPTLIPRDPELIRQIMVRDFNCFSDRGVHIDEDSDPLFGKNLIMLQGSKWREMRTALSPAFSASRSRSMAPLMAECATNAATHLRSRIGNGKEIDTDHIVSAYVNDVIASCAFGFSVDSLKEPDNCVFRLGQKAVIQHTTQVMKFFGYENFPTFMKLLGVKIIASSAADQFSKLFKTALKSRREKVTEPRPDFIQTLVDAAQGKLKQDVQDDNNNSNNDSANWSKKFTDDDLVAQAVLFYVAGFDTTANLINFFLYEIAMNPDVQRKLQMELDATISSEETNNLYETVQGLEYLEMVVSEVLRLWPLVGAADRRSVASYDFGPTHEGSNQRLIAEAGIHVWLPLYSIHRDPEYWTEPDKCDPDRFAPANRVNIKPYTYLPFGTGPRHCIGSRFAVLAAKVLICGLLREYSFKPSTRTPAPQRLAPRAFILRPAEGFPLIIEPRSV